MSRRPKKPADILCDPFYSALNLFLDLCEIKELCEIYTRFLKISVAEEGNLWYSIQRKKFHFL